MKDRRDHSSSTERESSRSSPREAGKGPSVSAASGSRPIQRKAAAAGEPSAASTDADPVETASAGFAGAGRALPHLDPIQRSFGRHDVSQATAHVGGPAAEAAGALGAEAYTSGDQVGFAESPDLHLVAHEAAHVVQQRAGVQLKSAVGAAGDPYERNADAAADAVVRGESAEGILDGMVGGGSANPVVQRKDDDKKPNGHRGRIQVQGGGVEKSRSWTQDSPRTKAQGKADLTSLKGELTKTQLKIRDEAFEKAEAFIEATLHTAPPDVRRSFRNRSVIQANGDERVDVEILAGKAFQ